MGHGLINYPNGADVTAVLMKLSWVIAGHGSHPAIPGAENFAQGTHNGDVAASVFLLTATGGGNIDLLPLPIQVSPLSLI